MRKHRPRRKRLVLSIGAGGGFAAFGGLDKSNRGERIFFRRPARSARIFILRNDSRVKCALFLAQAVVEQRLRHKNKRENFILMTRCW
jgi:hypothetical protein